MKIKKTGFMIAALVLTVTLYGGAALANKSAVTIEAPDQAAKGTEVTIKIHVTHSANSFMHYTNWVKVMVNGQQAHLWEYSSANRPEDAKFTKEIKLTINAPTEIAAEANCNLHGGQGPAKKTIAIME